MMLVVYCLSVSTFVIVGPTKRSDDLSQGQRKLVPIPWTQYIGNLASTQARCRHSMQGRG